MRHLAHFRDYFSDDRGSAVMEYGLLAGCAAAATVTGLDVLNAEMTNLFTGLAGTLDQVTDSLRGR